MSTKNNSLVFGYVRGNYHLHVPEEIVKICLLFFDPEIIIKFKGKDLQKFVDPQRTDIRRIKIKFNHHLSFTLAISANFKREGTGKYFSECLKGFMADSVDHYAICYELFCVETQSIVALSHRVMDKTINQVASAEALTLSECKQQKELTFKFIIHSLELKYKKKIDPLFYPSLNARMLKQETSLNWNIDKKRVENCAKQQAFVSEIIDNWSVKCYPNGYDTEYTEGLAVNLCLMSWPLAISKMVMTIKSTIILNSEVLDEAEWDEEVTLDDYKDGLLWFYLTEHNAIKLEQIENIVCNVTVNINKLYDMDDVEIPVEKWKDHNVQISNVQ